MLESGLSKETRGIDGSVGQKTGLFQVLRILSNQVLGSSVSGKMFLMSFSRLGSLRAVDDKILFEMPGPARMVKPVRWFTRDLTFVTGLTQAIRSSLCSSEWLRGLEDAAADIRDWDVEMATSSKGRRMILPFLDKSGTADLRVGSGARDNALPAEYGGVEKGLGMMEASSKPV